MKDFLDFLKNKTVHRHFMYAIGGLLAFILLAFLSLRVYTRHGQALLVPDFVGLTVDEASQKADEKDLAYEIIDSVFIQGQKPGTVVSQSPSSFSKVKSGHTIFLTINAINPEKINMPNLVGVSIRQAEAILQSKGLRIGFKRYKPDIAKDFVLDQLFNGRTIRAGAKIIKGSAVDLVLGLGTGNGYTIIPSVKGLSQADAQDVLSNNYLNFGAMIYDKTIENRIDSLQAVIVRQKPESGTSIGTGAAIDVWLTKATAPADSI